MEEKSIGRYFSFGTCVRYLQDVRQGQKIAGRGFVISNLDNLLKYLNDLNLQVSVRAAFNLRTFRTEIAKTPTATKLTAAQAKALRGYITDLRKTLEPEMAGFKAYVVTPKRLDTNYLLTNVSALFAPGIYIQLPDIARYDFQEAAKCIAFERPTSAAFHMLRATEDVLRKYYCHYVRQNRSDLMWGPIVTDLRVRPRTKGKTTLLNNLDNIRLSYRNPTQHPEKTYDIHEAQDLWSLCVEVANRMINDINAHSKLKGKGGRS